MSNFKCQRCGQCCDGSAGIGWVEIFKGDIKKWEREGIFKSLLPKLNTTDGLSLSGYIIDFCEHGDRCPFLLFGQATCLIQQKYGREMKPSVCSRFGTTGRTLQYCAVAKSIGGAKC